jgi:hypothetical protein
MSEPQPTDSLKVLGVEFSDKFINYIWKNNMFWSFFVKSLDDGAI